MKKSKLFYVLSCTAVVLMLAAFAAPLSSSANSQPANASAIEVKLIDGKIEMPATIAAGATTFNITNAGKSEHNFAIEGSGMTKSLDATLKPGESKSLTVDLKAGTYKVWCPVGDHEKHGMVMTLTVTQTQ